jgi:hypothetical protein
MGKLMPMLIDLCKHKEDNIRQVVAENIGRLFVVYSNDMINDIEKGFKSPDDFTRSTIVKSFKYSGV